MGVPQKPGASGEVHSTSIFAKQAYTCLTRIKWDSVSKALSLALTCEPSGSSSCCHPYLLLTLRSWEHRDVVSLRTHTLVRTRYMDHELLCGVTEATVEVSGGCEGGWRRGPNPARGSAEVAYKTWCVMYPLLRTSQLQWILQIIL